MGPPFIRVAAIFIAKFLAADPYRRPADHRLDSHHGIDRSAGAPTGMVTLAMVLTAAGIPQVGIALILGMDRLLDIHCSSQCTVTLP